MLPRSALFYVVCVSKYNSESSPTPRSRHPQPSDVETLVEVLAEGLPLVDPTVAGGAAALASCMRALADSISNPYTLRHSSDGSSVVDGLHDVVNAAADAVDAVAQWVYYAGDRGDLGPDWAQADRASLHEVGDRLRDLLPLLSHCAHQIEGLPYTGPSYGDYVTQARGVVDELLCRGATVVYETSLFDRTPDDGAGWRIYFEILDDSRLFSLTGEPVAGMDCLPAFLSYDNVHPALITDFVLSNLDQFAVEPTTFDGDLLGSS